MLQTALVDRQTAASSIADGSTQVNLEVEPYVVNSVLHSMIAKSDLNTKLRAIKLPEQPTGDEDGPLELTCTKARSA